MTGAVKFKDVHKAGYKIIPVNQGNSAQTEDINKIHARLENEAVDYQDFFDNCLVSVNGFYHLLDTNGQDGVTVIDANRSLNISRQNQMGLLNFRSVGGVKRHRFTQQMITSYLDDSPEVGTVRVSIPDDIDIDNKTVMFSLGGYMRFLDSTFITRVSDRIFKFNFNNLPFLNIYFESKKYIDLSSLPLQNTTFNQEQISTAQLISAQNLIAYFLLTQSFIIVVDTPNLLRRPHHVKKTGLPGQYIGYSEPKFPLVIGYGRHPEYWHREEDGQYSIAIWNNVVENKLFDTILLEHINSTDGGNRPDYPGEFADAYLLEIYTE